MRCIGTPARRNADRTYASAKPMNGTVASRPCAGKHMMIGLAAPPGRAQLCRVELGSPRYLAASRSVNTARSTLGSPSPIVVVPFRRLLVAITPGGQIGREACRGNEDN